MTKTPSVAFCTRTIQITRKQDLYTLIDEAPMKTRDFAFLADIIEGLDNEALAQKYKKSPSRISQWKRCVFEQFHRFLIAQEQNTSRLEKPFSRLENQLSNIENTLSRLDNSLSRHENSSSSVEN